jgi:hypothetical protein
MGQRRRPADADRGGAARHPVDRPRLLPSPTGTRSTTWRTRPTAARPHRRDEAVVRVGLYATGQAPATMRRRARPDADL